MPFLKGELDGKMLAREKLVNLDAIVDGTVAEEHRFFVPFHISFTLLSFRVLIVAGPCQGQMKTRPKNTGRKLSEC